MKILLTGSTGFIGQTLIKYLRPKGYQIIPLVRANVPDPEKSIWWDPYNKKVDPNAFENFDALIHLSGKNITDRRWSNQQKQVIYQSRVSTTAFLAQIISQLSSPPKVWICASAIGYYGNRGDAILTEDAPPGSGFLARLCVDWENASLLAVQRGIRVVHLRLGVALGTQGGALARLLPIFRWGLGGTLGQGNQFMSWIAIDDVIRAIEFILVHECCNGPINIVAPNPVTNKEFTRSLGKVLRRPTVFPIPAPLLRLIFGELANEVLLASTRAIPAKLTQHGFIFQFPELISALSHLVKTTSDSKKNRLLNP